MLKIKFDNIFMSKLFLKFLNTFIFFNLKLKMEKIIYLSFFFWKKKYKTTPLFFFFSNIITNQTFDRFLSLLCKKKTKKDYKNKTLLYDFYGALTKSYLLIYTCF